MITNIKAKQRLNRKQNLKFRILKKRKWIQKRRTINDWQIVKKMYWGPAKLRMLINYPK